MSNNENNPGYHIDFSREKYDSRYDRLLNILYYSKEIPSDLYQHMNMSSTNFRKAISILKQRGYIKRISRDGAIGYILTNSGKLLTSHPHYIKYKSCLEDDNRQYDIKHRTRKRQFAYLYALLDRMGIPYESDEKPDISETIDQSNHQVYFYTALDFKRMLGVRSTVFKGSRVLGFFGGRGKIIPVYRTNHDMKTFSKQEGLLPYFLTQVYSIPVSGAILICNDEKSVIDITKQIIANYRNDDKKGINTAKYSEFYVFDSGDNFYSRFEDLYNDHSDLMHRLIEQGDIETTDRDDEGRYRLRIGTGFYHDAPVWFCPGNINAVTLRLFIHNAETNAKMNYIICQDRDLGILKETAERPSLRVGSIREQ
ncbi:hypothetical protein [Ruminococcus difficilis]|uniref:Uncharacterized protein n=1 Tax=Ruminococcus difficilis TaxID=2763069 RepID=A0A934TY35_9FIRM|nr:hypothetical protein [Ruminococcus difficilis]MBK6087661.1 hypothetical protein [Ruminococcus difficilis]